MAFDNFTPSGTRLVTEQTATGFPILSLSLKLYAITAIESSSTCPHRTAKTPRSQDV
jgi:hypothetical protein